jgi:hypothetical protein
MKFSSTAPAWVDSLSDRPAPVMPDFASTTTFSGSMSCLIGPSASSVAVA